MERPLKHHGRYSYRPITDPAPYRWPQGRGLAVMFALNLEAYAFGEGIVDELVPAGPGLDVINYPWLDYGNRVGAHRLRTLFAEVGLPVTLLANSDVYAACPGLIESFRADGAEIACHGRTNSERQGELPESEERALIAEATETIARQEGKPPAGWLGPWISESRVTPDLLKEAGYRYFLDWCCDDRPVPFSTRSGPLMLVPYPQEPNDANAIVVRRMNADAFADMVVDQFDEMLRQAEGDALVMSIALHPHVTGQPFRLKHLRRALTHIASARDRIWAARAGEIAEVAIRGHGAA
jgi:peptidoglycan/xylan/chitin deacetylase (PgdA/CDA1 family)